MAAGVPGKISSGERSTACRTDHLLPLARAGEPASTVRASPDTSSEWCSEASRGTARHVDDAEVMGKQQVPSAYAMGGRGGHRRRRSSSSNGSRALTHHHSASSPVSGRKTNGGDAATSFIALRLDEEQESLLTRAIIGPQAAKQASLPGRRVEGCSQVPLRFFLRKCQHVAEIDDTDEEISHRISEKEDEVDGQKCWQIDRMPSRILSDRNWNSEYWGAFEGSGHIADFKKPCPLAQNIKIQAHRLPSVLRRVDEASQVPPRFIQHNVHEKAMHQTRSSYNYHQLVGARDATDGWKLRKAIEMEDEVADQKDWQTAIVASCSSSAQDWDAESNGISEAIIPDSDLKKVSATAWNIILEKHKHPSFLGRSVEGGNQVPPSPRSIAIAKPYKLMRQPCFSHNYSTCVHALDAIDEARVSKVLSNFRRQLHSSPWITLAIIVLCIACFPTPAGAFQMHSNVETAANVLRGIHNINEIQNQLLNELGVDEIPAQPFDWGLLFFFGALFLVWFIIAWLGDISAGEQPAPLPPQVLQLDSGTAITIVVWLTIIGALIILAWRSWSL